MARKIKIEAKDVDTAIAKGLKELGLRRDQAEVIVLTRPSKGFLGIGAKQAVVEVRQKRWQGGNLDSQIYMDVPRGRSERSDRKPRGERGGEKSERNERGAKFNKKGRPGRRDKKDDRKFGDKKPRSPKPDLPKEPKANEPQLLPSEVIQHAVIPENLKAPMAEAKDMLSKMLEHMGIKVENLNVWWDAAQQRILLTFDCDHPAIVIGKEGKTLEAVQYLLTLALSRHFSTPISVMADTQNYWRKAEDKLNREIERGIDTVKKGGKVYRLRPMPAQMRRYIHRALENNELVETGSEGEGKWRKVVIKERVTPVGQIKEENKAAEVAAESPAKCVSPELDQETANAEIKLDGIIAAEKAAKKEAAQKESPACDCDVTPSQESAVLHSAPESIKECKLDEMTADAAREEGVLTVETVTTVTAEEDNPPQEPQPSAEENKEENPQ